MEKSSKTIKYIIVDDHEVLRFGLRHLLNQDNGFDYLGEATNGIQAIQLVKELNPDLILLDILMPKMNGIEAGRQIKKYDNTIKIVMFSSLDDLDYIDKAIAIGADGYLIKSSDLDDITNLLKLVMKGNRIFSEPILLKMEDSKNNTFHKEGKATVLSKREQEILNSIALGQSNKEISETLFLSLRTVERHRSNIMKKLKITNVAGLIRYSVLNHS